MAKFTVNIRAIKHLTRELEIEASTAEEARAIVARTSIGGWDESEPEDIQVESIEPAPEPGPIFSILLSADNDREQHFVNLNMFRDHRALGKFWKIDDAIYEEFLNILPPQYVPGGFRLIEKLTGTIAATFLTIGDDNWCGYTDAGTLTPIMLLEHIHENHQ